MPENRLSSVAHKWSLNICKSWEKTMLSSIAENNLGDIKLVVVVYFIFVSHVYKHENIYKTYQRLSLRHTAGVTSLSLRHTAGVTSLRDTHV